MQKVKLADKLTVTSTSSGDEQKFSLSEVVPGLAAKHLSVYVQVHVRDSDTRVAVAAEHSPDPVAGWEGLASDPFDSGSTTGISIGMHAGDSVEITNADQIRFTLKVQKTSGGSGAKSAVVSLWAILKPF